jgi:hypothetical protein
VRDDTWRRDGTTNWHGPYLTYLANNGYTLAEVEEYAVSNQPPNRGAFKRSSQPDEVVSALARYLTVRSVGYIEAVRDDLADLSASATGHPRLHKRITHHLRGGLGVNPKQLLDFVGSFDLKWRDSLAALLDADDQILRNQLGAMVAARGKIAHGDGENVTTGRSLAWGGRSAHHRKSS